MTSPDADSSLARRIGARLRLLRKNQQLTLAVVAQRAALSVSYLSAVENGVNLPSLPLLARLTEVLGASIPAVLADEGSPFAVVGEIPVSKGAVSVSHPLLQLRNVVLHSGAGDTGASPVPLEGRDLFVFVRSGTLTMLIDGQSVELDSGEAVDVSRPEELSWAAATEVVSVWSSCPEQT